MTLDTGGKGIACLPPWEGGKDLPEKHWYGRRPWEWMPTPNRGRVFTRNSVMKSNLTSETIYAEIVPGPNGSWQLVRVELKHPFARGFRTKDDAHAWVERAMDAGVLPSTVVIIEPPSTE